MDDTTIKLLMRALAGDGGDWETRAHLVVLRAARGEHEEAVRLVTGAPVGPPDEATALAVAEALVEGDANMALGILDGVLAGNRASARAHWIRAKIFRGRGLVEEARKAYNVAAVIDEAFEDAEFEAWLDGKGGAEAGSGAGRQRVASGISAGGGITEVGGDEEEFTETDGVWEEEIVARRPAVQFKDVGGMEELKERIRMKIIYPFKNQGVFAKFKKRAGGGLLLYGPPGCGKTLMARATAGECGAAFLSLSISEVLSKWFGESEKRVHEIFEEARRRAPSVVFIDELDALGVKRSEARGSMASLVNVMLTEIDGATSENADVLVLGATNTPWLVDSAFRRPGRFDKVVFVPPPDVEARAVLFRMFLEELPAEGVDVVKLAKAADKFSGADVRHVVESAVEAAIAEEMRTGRDVVLTHKMLAGAVKAHRATTLEWLGQASNYASYANQSGLYDELAEYLRGGV